METKTNTHLFIIAQLYQVSLSRLQQISLLLVLLVMLYSPTQRAFGQDVNPRVSNTPATNKVTLSGYVKDAKTGEEVADANVSIVEVQQGVLTNAYGFFSLTLKPGTYTILVRYLGYRTFRQTVVLNTNQQLNVQLQSEDQELEEIVVTGEREDQNVQSIQMSVSRIDIQQVKELPNLMGEPDILKIVQMQPGVISAGEGTSAFFVRGGSADQNLILIDEAPVYDPTHVFGLFSVFNADVIKSTELHKGGIPAQFGGRLSSILDVRTKDGNNKEFHGTGSIGPLMAKVMLEGPIVKEKSSFLVSGRRSFIDLFTPFLQGDASENKIFFYDLNAKVSFKPTNKDRFFIASYLGRDRFTFGANAGFGWGNATGTLRWNHLFSERFFSNTTVVFTNFDYSLDVNQATTAFQWKADMQVLGLNQDMTYYLNPNNTLRMGGSVNYRAFQPGIIKPTSDRSVFRPITLERTYAMDYALYLSNQQTFSRRFMVEYGLRLSIFQNVGKTKIYNYQKGPDGLLDNRNINRLDTTNYGTLEPIITYVNPEPRLSLRYVLDTFSSVKASYNRMAQNIHLLSNSTVPIPFNTWAPSSPYLKPQVCDQIAAGYFRNFADNKYEFAVESYYKWMNNVTDFADMANLFLNDDVATEFRQGKAFSYGLEFLLRKAKGRMTGQISYTLSKTEMDIKGVNLSRPYPANYDRRHALNIMAVYDLNEAWNFGAAFSYSTGRAFTMPEGLYRFQNYEVQQVSERNKYRLPDFHRLDLSANYNPRKNATRKWKHTYNFSVYNAYGRQNAFTYTVSNRLTEDGFVEDPREKVVQMTWLFSVIPSFSYTLSF
jgi:hypothetical protein